ncbi:retrovirus-related pol polyprotein from transposon TNT 1-94 [Tanacetum coccineum]
MNTDKKVRFAKPVTSSSNIPKKTDSFRTKDSNKPLLTSTGVNTTTSASGSKPSGNTKKNRISRPPSSNMKNKVEEHPRKVKSSLNKTNSISEPISNVHIKHFVRNAKFESICAICNKCLFDTNHVAFRKHTCFIRDLEGVDLLKGSRGLNLYTLSMENLLLSSPICLLSKALKTKSWLWHQRLSHLNFDYITSLAKQGLVQGLPKLKYQKDHLCSACALGKSKKHFHKPKAEDSIQEKLYLLHMDLCGPMRIQSINGIKYILVIVDDYSRKHDLSYLHVFGALCYPNNDSEDFEPAVSTGTPFSTIIDQDPPSTSTSQTNQETPSPVIPLDVEEVDHDIKVAHMDNNPYVDFPIPELSYEEPSSKELVPRSDRVMIITLKWIYKVKLDELGAPRAWYALLSLFLLSQKFSKGTVDPTLFIRREGKDILLSPRGIFLNQSKYALESLNKYGMETCDPVDTPMMEKSKLDEDPQGEAVDTTCYHGMIGTLMYLTSNANHTGCQDTRKSTSRSMQLLADRLMRSQLTDYGLGFNKIPLYCDNKSAIALCCNNVQHSRSKHIDSRHHFIKEQVENGVVELYFFRTEYQLEDIFTKPLA